MRAILTYSYRLTTMPPWTQIVPWPQRQPLPPVKNPQEEV